MAYEWWEVGSASAPAPSAEPDLDWSEVDNLAQIQALEPRFVPYAERLYAATRQAFEEEEKGNGDGWGFVKDVGAGLKKGLGWTADKLADYNERFVAPTAAWMYGGVKGGVEAPNPLKAFAGNREEMEKAEQTLGNLHWTARLALEFAADPLVWGTLPLTMGGGTLAKVAGKSAQLAANAHRAGKVATAGQEAALLLYNVGKTADMVGHIPDRLMMAALKPVGAAVGKVPLLPVSTAEGGVMGMKLAPLGKMAKTTQLRRTYDDTITGLRALSYHFMGEADETVRFQRALGEIAEGRLTEDARKLLTAAERDMADDLVRFKKDINLGDYIEKLGRPDEDIIGVTQELARNLRDVRSVAWKVPKAATEKELDSVMANANRLYRGSMMTWVWGVLWSTNYMFQNMITDLMVAGPSALYYGVKARIGKTIMPNIPYARLQADLAKRNATVLQSTALRRMRSPEEMLAFVREIAVDQGLNPDELLLRIGDQIGTTSFMAPAGMRTDSGFVVNQLAKMVNANAPEMGSYESLVKAIMHKLATGGEVAALAPLRWAQWWDSTMWIGCMERHMAKNMRQAAIDSPEMGGIAATLANIGKTEEFKALPGDVQQALMMTWERSVTPDDIIRRTFDLAKATGEFTQVSSLSSAVPLTEATTESLDKAIMRVLRATGKQRHYEGFDRFWSNDLLADVYIPASRQQIDMRQEYAVGLARERNFTTDQIKEVSDHMMAASSSFQDEMGAVEKLLAKKGGLTGDQAEARLVAHVRRANSYSVRANYIQETVANTDLGAAEVIERLNKLRGGIGETGKETRFAVAEMHNEVDTVANKIRHGAADAEGAWTALAENPRYGIGADMGVFATREDDPGVIRRLWNADKLGADRMWGQMERNRWAGISPEHAKLVAAEGELPRWVSYIRQTLKGEWKKQMNTLTQFESGQVVDTAMRYAREVAEQVRAMPAEASSKRAGLLLKAQNDSVEAANAILGNFYEGVTNFDELVRHIFPFVRWSTRAPAIVARYTGRNPWFVPQVSRWVTETEKENLSYFGAWMPTASIPLVGTLLAEPARQFAPYQMIRPIVGGPEIFGRGTAQQALSTLGVAGFFPGPLPQAVIGRLAGESTSPTGEFLPGQRGVTQPMMVAGQELKALAESAGLPGELANAANALGLPEEILGTLADLAYGEVSQDIFHRDVERELVNMGLDIAEVEENSDQWRQASRAVMTRRAIRFVLPFFQPISDEQLAYTRKQADAFIRVGISQAEQIALRREGKSPWDMLNREQSAKVSKFIGEEEMRRRAKVVPLGLTEGEAKTWYTVQSARALVQLKYDDLHSKLGELGLMFQKGEITGREYREQRGELKGNNYYEVLAVRQQAIAERKGTNFAAGLDENGVRREWQGLTESMRSSVGATAPRALQPEDEALEGYQEIRAENYLQPDGEIDWASYKDEQIRYLTAVAPQHAEYIIRYEQRFEEELPVEQMYRQALKDIDEWARIPRYVGVSPQDQWRISGVQTMVGALQSVFRRMTMGERSLAGRDAVTILVQQGKISSQDAILYLTATPKNYNPESEYYRYTHDLLGLFGLDGSQGQYLNEPAPLEQATEARAEIATQ